MTNPDLELITRLQKENSELKIQFGAAKSGWKAAQEISEFCRKEAVKCRPAALESEREANAILTRSLEEAQASLEVLASERESFISYLSTLNISNRPLLVGPIQLAKWYIEQLTNEQKRINAGSATSG